MMKTFPLLFFVLQSSVLLSLHVLTLQHDLLLLL